MSSTSNELHVVDLDPHEDWEGKGPPEPRRHPTGRANRYTVEGLVPLDHLGRVRPTPERRGRVVVATDQPIRTDVQHLDAAVTGDSERQLDPESVKTASVGDAVDSRGAVEQERQGHVRPERGCSGGAEVFRLPPKSTLTRVEGEQRLQFVAVGDAQRPRPR